MVVDVRFFMYLYIAFWLLLFCRKNIIVLFFVFHIFFVSLWCLMVGTRHAVSDQLKG